MIKFVLLSWVCTFLLNLSIEAQQKSEIKKENPEPLAHKIVDPFTASIKRGLVVYKKECLSCHQEDGSGVPRMAPTLIRSRWVLGGKFELIKLVLNGSNTNLTPDGEPYHIPMAPQNHLTDRQIADVLTYIRNGFGNKVVAVNAAEVKAARTTIK